MRPTFAGHPVAGLLLFATLAVWLILELRQGLSRRPGARSTDRGSLQVLRVAGIAGGVFAVLAVHVRATAFPYSSAGFGVSLAVIWAGILLRWWSFRTLGRYFTFTVMTSPDQAVITSGPYRILRHPSYLGLLLILGGIALTYGNWLSVAALVVLPLLGLFNRIRVEEAALSTTLGARYIDYAAGRKRLVPFVW